MTSHILKIEVPSGPPSLVDSGEAGVSPEDVRAWCHGRYRCSRSRHSAEPVIRRKLAAFGCANGPASLVKRNEKLPPVFVTVCPIYNVALPSELARHLSHTADVTDEPLHGLPGHNLTRFCSVRSARKQIKNRQAGSLPTKPAGRGVA